LAYITNGAVLTAFDADIRAAKMVGFAFLVGSLILLGLSMKRRGMLLLCCGYAAASLLVLQRSLLCLPIASWVRPDSQLLFWASFAAFCATRERPLISAMGTGLAMGMCMNLKLHGAAYVFPMFLLVYEGGGVRAAAISVLWAVIVAAAPFLVFSNVSLLSYLELLRIATQHGLTIGGLIQVWEYATFLLSPILAVFFLNLVSSRGTETQRCVRKQVPLLAATLFATIVVSVPAAKPGAGAYYFVPLVPAYALVLATFASYPRAELTVRRWAMHAAVSVICTFSFIAVSEALCSAYSLCEISRFQNRIACRALDEIAEIRCRYPQARIGMGYGSESHYSWTFYRANLTATGAPYLLDVPMLDGQIRAGRSLPKATRDAVREGQVQIWLLPAGDEPFTIRAFYPGDPPLFDQQFRDDFRTCYRRQKGTEHYDLWVYQGATASATKAFAR
jgi:hypothetical protein